MNQAILHRFYTKMRYFNAGVQLCLYGFNYYSRLLNQEKALCFITEKLHSEMPVLLNDFSGRCENFIYKYIHCIITISKGQLNLIIHLTKNLNRYLYYYYRNDNEDDNYQTNFSLDKITLPSGHTWKYVFGNDYKLYIIDSNGVLAYIQSIDDEWHYANQSEPSAITQWQTLNSFDMQSAQFCASKKNDAVMGLFTDTNDEVSFARTYCGNYR